RRTVRLERRETAADPARGQPQVLSCPGARGIVGRTTSSLSAGRGRGRAPNRRTGKRCPPYARPTGRTNRGTAGVFPTAGYGVIVGRDNVVLVRRARPRSGAKSADRKALSALRTTNRPHESWDSRRLSNRLIRRDRGADNVVLVRRTRPRAGAKSADRKALPALRTTHRPHESWDGRRL